MNIAFDSYAILGPMSRNRGIGNYALSQFTFMINQDKENHYFFLNMLDPEFHLCDYLEQSANFSEDYLDIGKKQFLLRNPVYQDVIGAAIQRYLKENRIDVFYITSPFELSFSLYRKEWFDGVKVVMTVYDIIPYVMRDKYLAEKKALENYIRCVDTLRWADALYVISESVKTDLVTHLHFDASRIQVIWGAVDVQYRILEIPEEEKKALFQKFGVQKNYIMCTGGEDSRKNLDGLIRAYGLLPESIRQKYQLVVVCKLSPSALKRLTAEAERCHVKDDVIFTNFVTSKELLYFYNLATLMAFPSKYEGFGLPIVEAWACGTPVLTASNSSLVQIGGDAVVLADAESDQSIADGMKQMLSDDNALAYYRKKGMERLALYRWEIVADTVIRYLNALPLCEKKAFENRFRIAFFTPLPPKQSGISDYSVDIINTLCRYCDIDVYIDAGYSPECNFPDNVQIFEASAYPQKCRQYRNTVFQLGNSDFHFYMYPYIRRFHGIVVLHDYNLHGAFYHHAIVEEKNQLSCYQEFVQADYPDIQKIEQAPLDIYGMELNGFLTAHADRIIVHSAEAKEKLLKRDISRNVTILPSYAMIFPLADAEKRKAENGFPTDTLLLSAFGGIHSTKRAIPILKAFAKLRKEIPSLRLLFAGKLSDEIKEEFQQFVKENGLSDSVTVTGYINLETFKTYIDMTDICLNLRYPSNGETSGSLMRIFGRGKCVIINNIGSFSEFPDDICVKLPSVKDMGEEREPEEIYLALQRLIVDETLRNQYAQAARKYAEAVLDLEKVARQYYSVVSEVLPPPSVTEAILETIKQDMDFLPSDISGIAGTLAYAKGDCHAEI